MPKPKVAPLVGAWIEIVMLVCGFYLFQVAPLVGAWIEIIKVKTVKKVFIVAPLVGAWIEILILVLTYTNIRSLLSWERGLK